MNMAFSRTIVSTGWLKSQFPALPRRLKILDSSWTAVQSGKESYLKEHIPGATFFDLNECVKAEPTLPRNLPDPLLFRDYVRSLGVSTDSQIVVYDRGGILPSARTWWTFRLFGHNRIAVLDGGLKKWINEGNVTESGEGPSVASGDFNPVTNYQLSKNFEKISENVKNRTTQIIDARRPEHYRGEETEPTNFTKKALEGMGQPMPSSMLAGHIPGAINLLEDLVLDPQTKCLLPKEELQSLFQANNIDLSKDLSTMCYNGHAATLLALAMTICGKEDTPVYYGSWTEYGQRAAPDMVTRSKQPNTLAASGA